MIDFSGMKREDKMFILSSIVAPIIIWWALVGRTRYSVKGMK